MVMLTVREKREAAGLTQFELAHLSGVALRALQDIERNQGNPQVNTLAKIAGALGMPLSELFAEEIPA